MKPGLTTVAAITLFFLSCTKKDDAPLVPSYNQSYTWTYGGVQYTADSSAAYSNGITNQPTIFAWNKGSSASSFKIAFKVTSFNYGGYQVVSTAYGHNPPPPGVPNNYMYYYDDNGNELKVINGAVNVLSNTNGRLSGEFTANVLDADSIGIYLRGNFTDVPVRP